MWHVGPGMCVLTSAYCHAAKHISFALWYHTSFDSKESGSLCLHVVWSGGCINSRSGGDNGRHMSVCVMGLHVAYQTRAVCCW